MIKFLKILFRNKYFLFRKHKSHYSLGTNSSLLAAVSWLDNFTKSNSLVIGDNSLVRGHVAFLRSNASILIGSNTAVGANTLIMCANEIIIGSNVLISFDCLITDNNSHSLNHLERRHDLPSTLKGNDKDWTCVVTRQTIIENDVWIGAKSIILKGIVIGERSIVAAGSIVTKSVPPDSIVAGNPAKLVRRINFYAS